MIRVLLIEDDRADAELFRLAFRHLGVELEVVHSNTLGDALNVVAFQEFDAVILDLHLSDSFGPETVHRLRTANPRVPVHVMTGHEDHASRERARELGATGYWVKGNYDPAELVAALSGD